MKRLLYAVVLLMAVSCGLTEVGEPVRRPGGGVWTGPGVNVGKYDPDKTVCYVTLMSYADGYDWRPDWEKGSVRCSLVVLADGIPMMKVPVGDEYETSSDPDMHRIVDGHLYTDFSTSSETVVKKDGRLLFRYPGRELICGLIVDSSDVYTLGHPRDGGGFTYRRNGEILLQRTSGRSFARLYRDKGDICFAFSEPVVSASDTIERYYHVRNGNVSQEALREDVKRVWDILAIDGSVVYVADVVGVAHPVVCNGLSMHVLSMPQASWMASCRLLASAGNIYVEGIVAKAGKPLTAGIWTDYDSFHAFPSGMALASVCVSEGSVCCVLNSSTSWQNGQIYHNGRTAAMPMNYVSMGSRTAVMADGILTIGLSSRTGGKPQLWKDGLVQTLDYNGYICSVTTNKDQDSQETVLD